MDFGGLLSREYRALGAVNAGECYRYASGIGWAGDLAKMLREISDRKMLRLKHLLATAHARSDADPSATTRALASLAQQLREKFGAERVRLLSNTAISPDRYGEYRAISAAFFDEVRRLDAC